MAPRKKADDKSQPRGAAAVGAGTELVQAQAEQNKDGAVLVDPAAEAARLEAEQQAAEANSVTSDLPDWLIGRFDVKAKSPAGFWRCGVHFLHSSPTRVFVVTAKADVPHDHDCEIPCCYLTPAEAQRVHQESWLTVVPGSEVTKD